MEGTTIDRGIRPRGRADELEALLALVRRAATGQGGTAVLRGPAGIGKSTLLRGLAGEAAGAGARVLQARGFELERGFPYGVVRQLLDPVVRGLDAAGRERLGAGAAGLGLSLLEGREAAPAGMAPADRFPQLHGLTWLVAGLAAERPLVLLVDDAPWADQPSLEFLAFLARRAEELPVAVVAGAREDDAAALLGLLADARVEHLALGPLDVTACAALVRELAPGTGEAACEAVARAAAGVPLAVAELVRVLLAEQGEVTAAAAEALPTQHPGALQRGALLRIGRLGPDAVALARAVAILDEAPPARAATLAGLDMDGAERAADVLERAGVLEVGATWRFGHPVLRAAVADDLNPARRARLHRLAARAVAGTGGEPGAVAAHLALGTAVGDPWAVDALLEGARAAERRAEPGVAVELLRRALAEPPAPDQRRDVLAALGRAEARELDPQAVEHLTAAHAATADPAARAALALDLGTAQMLVGRLHDAVGTFDGARDALGDPGEDEARRALALRLEAAALGAARWDPELRRATPQRLARLDGVDGGTAAERLALAHVAFEQVPACVPAAEVAETALRALGDGRLLAEEGAASPAYVLPIWTLVFAEHLGAADREVRAALEDARRRGSRFGAAVMSTTQGLVRLRGGDLPGAEAALRAVDAPATPLDAPLTAAVLAEVLVERGDAEGAQAVLARVGLDGEVPDLPLFIPALFSRARLHVLRGDRDAAVADLREAGRRTVAWGSSNPTIVPWRMLLAELLQDAGESEEARALAAEAVAGARAFGAPRGLGLALRAAARCAPGGERLAGLQEAEAVLRRSGAALDLARTRHALGAELVRLRRTKEGRATLEEALDAAHRCGARPLEAQVLEDLRAIGARPRRHAVRGAASLTPSERRVAELAAEGRTNPQIAQALFVSRKTVETHLGSVFRKLDVGARAELAAALAD